MNNRKKLLIKNAKVYMEDETLERGHIYIEDNIIRDINENCDSKEDVPILDANGASVIPGFIDGHIHGANGADVMDATEEALDKMAKVLPQEGTTSFLATTMTQSKENISRALVNVAEYQNKPGQAEVLGIHLEGPFINKEKKGAQPAEYVLHPALELFDEWQKLSGNSIETVTLAPELDYDGKLIRHLYERGINVSAGHTCATYPEMVKAVDYGVRQVTHLCNAMTGLHHRDIGVTGAAFLLQSIRSELIADGHHVVPEMLELIYKNIGSDRLLLITDSMRAKCMPSGIYDLGGQQVTTEYGKATLEDGTLAGSILKLIDAAKLMFEINSVTIRDIIKMTSENPAKQIGVFKRKGSIAKGKDADLLIVDDDLQIMYTICRGEISFQG